MKYWSPKATENLFRKLSAVTIRPEAAFKEVRNEFRATGSFLKNCQSFSYSRSPYPFLKLEGFI
jgi:hypothetical protein